MHSFGGNATIFAEVTILGESIFDTELAMWYAKCIKDENVTALCVLQDLSQPSVVACENEDTVTACVWFLNYHRHIAYPS